MLGREEGFNGELSDEQGSLDRHESSKCSPLECVCEVCSPDSEPVSALSVHDSTRFDAQERSRASVV